MPQLLFQDRKTSKEGEVTVNINLTLTLKIEQDGSLHVVTATETKQQEKNNVVKMIPDLGDPIKLINFGNDV
jgi:hypothetical protein